MTPQTQIPYLSKVQVKSLTDDALLERSEELLEAIFNCETSRYVWLRTQLDMTTAEGERRKLICWAYPQKKKVAAKKASVKKARAKKATTTKKKVASKKTDPAQTTCVAAPVASA